MSYQPSSPSPKTCDGGPVTIRDFAASECLVLVPEWVVGDDGVAIRAGDKVSWVARPPGEDIEMPQAALINHDRFEAGQPTLPLFVRHPDDPWPPIEIVGRVLSVRALRWSNPPDGQLSLLSSPIVNEAWNDRDVDDYLIHVEGRLRSLTWDDEPRARDLR